MEQDTIETVSYKLSHINEIQSFQRKFHRDDTFVFKGDQQSEIFKALKMRASYSF